MAKIKPPEDGPHVPEESTYIEEFTGIMKKLSMCPGFSAEDSNFGFDSNNGVVFFRFSKNVVEKIIRPEFKNNKNSAKPDCHIAKSFKKVKILKDGRIKVIGASDSVHALYIAIALYVNQCVPEKKRARTKEDSEKEN